MKKAPLVFMILLCLVTSISSNAPYSLSSAFPFSQKISFTLTANKDYYLEGIELGIGAVYNITVTVNDLDNSHTFRCFFVEPPNASVNGNIQRQLLPNWPQLSFTDGMSVHFLLKSNNLTHLVPGWVNIEHTSGDMPETGISGEMTIETIIQGTEDNSFYFSYIDLNATCTNFSFNLFDQLSYDTFGNFAVIRFQINSYNSSQSKILVTKSYPRNYSRHTDFSPYQVEPGNISRYDFTFGNDGGDYTITFIFNIALSNTTSFMKGEIVCFLLKDGTRSIPGFNITLSILVFTLLLRGRYKRTTKNIY